MPKYLDQRLVDDAVKFLKKKKVWESVKTTPKNPVHIAEKFGFKRKR